MDNDIHANYQLYANNIIALDMLEDTAGGDYTKEEKTTFVNYLEQQAKKAEDILTKAGLTPDKAYLRERILTMYANPARNKAAAK